MNKFIDSLKAQIAFIWNWVTDNQDIEPEPMELRSISVAFNGKIMTIKTPWEKKYATYSLQQGGIRIMLSDVAGTHKVHSRGRFYINKRSDISKLQGLVAQTQRSYPREVQDIQYSEENGLVTIHVSYAALSGF